MAAATDNSNAAIGQLSPVLESIELTVINVPPSTAAAATTTTTAGGGGASLTIGHQMTNGSYKVLHTPLPSATTATVTATAAASGLEGYYTLVPDRSSGGDFMTATAYRCGSAKDDAKTALTMTRMDLA